eukprot:1178697-Prymnesium_polylepis.1
MDVIARRGCTACARGWSGSGAAAQTVGAAADAAKRGTCSRRDARSAHRPRCSSTDVRGGIVGWWPVM